MKFTAVLLLTLFPLAMAMSASRITMRIERESNKMFVANSFLPVDLVLMQEKGHKIKPGLVLHCKAVVEPLKSYSVVDGKKTSNMQIHLKCEGGMEFVVKGLSFEE